MLQNALDIAGDAVMICSCATRPPRVIYTNRTFEQLTGYSDIEMNGRPYDYLLPRSSADSSSDAVAEAVRAGRAVTTVLRHRHRSGAELQVEFTAAPARDGLGNSGYYVIVLRDLAQTQRQVEHLRFIANHDELTGLPNRRLLLDRFDQALTRHHRRGEGCTLAFIDLNELKQVNDCLGHRAGDELLKHVSTCLAASIRACDTVARYGGDEFVLLLTDAADLHTVTNTVARAIRLLDEPFTIAGRTFKVTCSIGVAVCPRDGSDAAVLLHAADEAMYRAKSGDRTRSSVHGLSPKSTPHAARP